VIHRIYDTRVAPGRNLIMQNAARRIGVLPARVVLT